MAMLSTELSRRSLIWHGGLYGLVALVPLATARAAQNTAIDVFRDPSCGCCGRWIDHLRQNGFSVNVVDTVDMKRIKKAVGVPSDLASCHTAKVAGYVVEGHVPPQAIRRLLNESPAAVGLAVPGMPIGSLGMEGGEPEVYDVIVFGDGWQKTFSRYKGQKRLSASAGGVRIAAQ